MNICLKLMKNLIKSLTTIKQRRVNTFKIQEKVWNDVTKKLKRLKSRCRLGLRQIRFFPAQPL